MNKRGGIEIAGVAAILIVCLVIAAFVVPWGLSLVDSDPPSPGPEGEYARSFVNEPGTVHTAWIAQRMTFSEDVEVVSVLANIGIWGGGGPAMCTVHAQLQVTNAVAGSAAVRFDSQTYEAVSGNMQYFGATVSGQPERLVAGTYYLAIRADCAEPGQADLFMWYFSFDDIVTDPTVVLIRHCADFNEDGLWDPTSGLECQPPVVSFILEGTVGWADEEPPDDANETVEPPPLVDTTVEKDDDYQWIMYAILGGVVIIVLIVALAAIRG